MRPLVGALTLAVALGVGGCFGSGDLDFEQGDAGADGGSGALDAAADTGGLDTADASAEDAGPGDTGPADTGPGDTGPADTGPADTGAGADVVDAGPAPDAGGDAGAPDAGPDTSCSPAVPYGDVQALWNKRCSGCHVGAALGGLSLDKGEALLVDKPSVAVPALDRVEPGDPSKSYLWLKLTDQHEAAGGGGSPMPVGGYPLPQAELDTIEAWILGLAPCP
ncbi:MAG: hypothetical protein AMXMBFR64_37110 [Myxococcales bacterium]